MNEFLLTCNLYCTDLCKDIRHLRKLDCVFNSSLALSDSCNCSYNENNDNVDESVMSLS